MLRKYREVILLVVIFILGTWLRFDRLTQNPAALNWDEVSHGVNAYSILKTGHDEWGITLPTIFRAFGDYKLPAYIYLTVLPVAFWGLSAFSIRFVSALAGSLAIIGIYWLTNSLFPNYEIKIKNGSLSLGLMSAFLLSLLPWHFFISRPALEANLSLTIIIFGFAFLLQKYDWSKFVGLLFLALSLHTYNSARVFIPLILSVWFWVNREHLKAKVGLLSGGAVLLASILLIAWQIQTGTGLARYQKLAIINEVSVYQIGRMRAQSHLPTGLARLIYNRPVYFVTTVGKNYLAYFSPTFVYQHQAQAQFAIPGINLYGWFVIIGALIGLFICLQKRDLSKTLVLTWLLLAPLPAALTADPPQALRPLYLIPAVVILAAIGITHYLQLFDSKVVLKTAALGLVVGLIGMSFNKYWQTYWNFYRTEYAYAWQDGYQSLWQEVLSRQASYDRVIVTKVLGEPHIYLAFYANLDPKDLMPGEKNIRFKQSDWYWTDKVDKYYFVNDWNLTRETAQFVKLESGTKVSLRKSLIVASAHHLPSSAHKLSEIKNVNGETIFEIGEIN
jgi:4-amino-4-deoxy-L-arabinose transferase-like glycosyltransferase